MIDSIVSCGPDRTEEFGFSDTDAGFISGCSSALAMSAAIAAGPVLDRIGLRRALFTFALFAPLAAVALAWSRSPAIFLAALFTFMPLRSLFGAQTLRVAVVRLSAPVSSSPENAAASTTSGADFARDVQTRRTVALSLLYAAFNLGVFLADNLTSALMRRAVRVASSACPEWNSPP
jgi:MFS family permease